MALHPRPREALVIGLGGGATAGALAAYPGVQLDVVELSGSVVLASHINGVYVRYNHLTVVGSSSKIYINGSLKYSGAGPAADGSGVPGSVVADPPGGVVGRIAARLTRRGTAGLVALMLALGVADVMFALDSIPAVFGLTRDPFLVFSPRMTHVVFMRVAIFGISSEMRRPGTSV